MWIFSAFLIDFIIFLTFVAEMKKKCKHRIAILASGSGTNTENLMKYFANDPCISISLVMSNKADALVLERARKFNVPAFAFNKADLYQNKSVFDVLKAHEIDFIVLAGFLWKIPDDLLQAYPKKIVNIHPALLPKYGGPNMYGDRVHKAVKEYGEKHTGISIHYVNEHYDEGELIFQATCDIDPEKESIEEIAAKVHQLEYIHYPEVIKKILDQRE